MYFFLFFDLTSKPIIEYYIVLTKIEDNVRFSRKREMSK